MLLKYVTLMYVIYRPFYCQIYNSKISFLCLNIFLRDDSDLIEFIKRR